MSNEDSSSEYIYKLFVSKNFKITDKFKINNNIHNALGTEIHYILNLLLKQCISSIKYNKSTIKQEINDLKELGVELLPEGQKIYESLINIKYQFKEIASTDTIEKEKQLFHGLFKTTIGNEEIYEPSRINNCIAIAVHHEDLPEKKHDIFEYSQNKKFTDKFILNPIYISSKFSIWLNSRISKREDGVQKLLFLNIKDKYYPFLEIKI